MLFNIYSVIPYLHYYSLSTLLTLNLWIQPDDLYILCPLNVRLCCPCRSFQYTQRDSPLVVHKDS